MGDSPAPSPVSGSGFPGQPTSESHSPHVTLEPSTPPAPMANPFEESEAGEREFLDMDQGDHDDENDGDEEGEDEDEDVDDEGSGSGNQQQPLRNQPLAQMQQPPSITQPFATNDRSPGKAARAAVEDFPLPPGAHVPQQGPPHAHVQAQQAHAHAQAQALAHAQAQAQARAQGQGLEYQQPQRSRTDPEISGPYSQTNLGSESYSSPYLPNAPSSSSSTSLMNSAQSQTLSLTSTTSPAFRALPLLGTDLPQTCISVSHSSIRPNDRGKEVLSFIIVVDPGRGKETWKVEKLYSDVLGLDQRIRASVGKGVGKKIASLPEGKLWRDHAPAKVDQRKVCACSDLAVYQC